MKTRLYAVALTCGCLFLLFCKNTNTKPVPAVTVKMQEYTSKKCVQDSVCAEIRMVYPVLSGGDSLITRRLNDSLEVAVYLASNADPAKPLRQALDSAAAGLYGLLKGDNEAGFPAGMSYTFQMESKIVLQTGKLLSVQMDGYSFTGGAHGYYYTVLNTFDLTTGASLLLTDIIRDTTALRPMLEKAFLAVHQEEAPESDLADLLLDPESPLAFPVNYCILQEGIRFMYNPYEVAPYAVGQTDITLSWQQLGALADRKQWLE